LLSDPPPPEFEALLDRRRRWGADTHDEVWKGVLHVNPAPHGRHAELQAKMIQLIGPAADAATLRTVGEFNLGEPDDFRVPDAGVLGDGPSRLYYDTALLVVEILSPGDESWQKLDFYAAHHVGELVLVDGDQHTVHWLALADDGSFQQVRRSEVLGIDVDELVARVRWPA
jgi:Uma2 family endonuclease